MADEKDTQQTPKVFSFQNLEEIATFLDKEGNKHKEIQAIFDRERTKAINSHIEKNLEKYKTEGATEIQKKYEKELDDLKKSNTRLQKTRLIERELTKYAKDEAVEDILRYLDVDKLDVENETVIGLNDKIELLKQKKPFFFKETKEEKKSIGGNATPKNTNLSEKTIDEQITEAQKAGNTLLAIKLKQQKYNQKE